MKKIILLFIFFFWTSVYCQTPAITINLSSNPSADTSVWGTGSNIFNIIVAGPHMDMLVESTVLVNIKSNGSIRCGGDTPNSAQPSNIVNGAAKSWIGPGAAGLLGEDCVLVPGTYELCVQFYGFKNATGQVVLLEKCVPFIIQGKNEAVCSPPININPANDKVFAARDLMSVMTFNWSPIISANHGLVTYRLLVWEVEEDQTNSVAIYNNQPFIDQEIKGQTSYNSLPGVFQKRKATYVWRVMAMDVEGKPICSKNQSEPTNFTTQAVASLANCLDFEGDYQTNVWSSFFVASIDIKNDSIHGNYMQFADDSGGSIAVDYHDFGGNWITKSTDGCLCFDFMVDWNADPSINTLARRGPSIVIFGGPQITYTGGVYNIASTPRAWPVWNNSMPFLVDGKWDKYCMPIALSSGGQLPSNAYMQWQIVDSTGILTGAAACAAWDTLIQNVTAMYIPTDYNDQPSELVNFDNFCWSCDSTVPPVEADCCSLATATGCLVIDQTKITVECGGVDAEGRQIYKVNNVIIKNTSTNVARTGLVSNSAGTNYVVAEPAGSFTITQLVPLSSNTISPGQEVHISFEAHLASGTSLSFFVEGSITSASGTCEKRLKGTIQKLPDCGTCSYCSDVTKSKIQLGTSLVNVTALNLMTIAQDFNISPKNIKKITAEIIYFEEDPATAACMKCTVEESWVNRFVSLNTESWNSASALNGSPVNSNGYYPSSMVEWNCNQQGNLKLNFKIPLAGAQTGCARKTKFGIRYSFTDVDCITCEKIVFYTHASN